MRADMAAVRGGVKREDLDGEEVAEFGWYSDVERLFKSFQAMLRPGFGESETRRTSVRVGNSFYAGLTAQP